MKIYTIDFTRKLADRFLGLSRAVGASRVVHERAVGTLMNLGLTSAEARRERLSGRPIADQGRTFPVSGCTLARVSCRGIMRFRGTGG